MILCIDAYNVIKHLLLHRGDTPEAQRQWLLAHMADYWQVKKDELSLVIVVFDGGLFSRRMREVVRGVVVLFAGHERSADDVIIEHAHKHRGQVLVVSNDRELQRQCQVQGAQALKVDEFWQLRHEAVAGAHSRQVQQFNQVEVTKFESDDEMPDLALDELMVAGSLSTQPERREHEKTHEARSSGKKMSKSARARARIYKKVG